MNTTTLADFILCTEYNEIPEKVIEQSKLCFIDFLGVALRGSETKSGIIAKTVVSEGNQSTVIGHGKANALEASLTNGIFAHALDLDDGHRYAQVHPGACVIPAALSLSEFRNISGKEFISSIIVGYQAAITLGMMVNPEHRNRGFHSTGTCGTLGAAAAASKALKLDKDQTINALGLGGTQAAGLLESDHSGSMGKHLHAGKAAQSGVLSALLSERGFTGAENILEGDEGFLKAMADINCKKIEFNMDVFRILEIYFKIYPVCRHLHSSIDAILHIINENNQNLEIEEIQEITVKTYKIASEHDNYHPHSVEALKQSLPVSLAIAVLKNELRLDNLNLNKDKKEIEEISKKIFIEYKEDFDALYPDKRPATVTINTKNGLYEKNVNLAYGEPENPLNKIDIIKKFHDLNPNVEIEVLEGIDDLESYKMNDFMKKFNDYIN
ncbi:MAG: MmgE/PrpD family protein [Methanobacterium sp.]|jgi:2-methylcitrate dehydratase PrpD